MPPSVSQLAAKTRLSLLPNLFAALGLAVVSLAGGMAGYMVLESQNVTDAFLSASMILSGMGPTQALTTESGKIFAGLYALYSGLFVLITAGLVLAPVMHNVMHRFHLGDDDRSADDAPDGDG
jgi:predicted lysophospholipase L1 biosynthesis ABC-type transport system permease subunit